MISEEERNQVREATDLVSLVQETVVLKPRGADDFWGCCPFHQEKTPSFHVRASSGLWYCFGCGEGGDVFEYIKRRENLDFYDAVRYLAQRAGIELHETSSTYRGPKRNRLEECLALAENYYQTQLMRSKTPEAQSAREYMASRGFSSEVCKKWGIGYAPSSSTLISDLLQKGFKPQELEAADLAAQRSGRLRDRFFNRVIFPIENEAGTIIGFGGRVLGDAKPKYLNSKDSSIWHKSKNLFALDRAKDSIVAKESVIIVEGYTDCISLHLAGFTQAVAVLGTALTQDHIKMLSRFRPKKIISLFDGDEAGQRAAEKVSRFVDKTEAELLVTVLPENLDPAEYLEKYGKEALQDELNQAVPVMDFVLTKEFEGLADWTPGKRMTKMKEIAELFAPLCGSLVLSSYVTNIADLLNVNESDVLKEIQIASQRQKQAESRQEAFEKRRQETSTNPASNSTNNGAHEASRALLNPSMLTQEEALRLKMERELLSLLVENWELFASDLENFNDVAWLDEIDQEILSVLKKQGKERQPSQIVSSIIDKIPEASKVLAAAEIEDRGEEQTKDQVVFLVKNISFLQKQAELRRLKTFLNTASSKDSTKMQDLLEKAASLQKEITSLQNDIIGTLD